MNPYVVESWLLDQIEQNVTGLEWSGHASEMAKFEGGVPLDAVVIVPGEIGLAETDPHDTYHEKINISFFVLVMVAHQQNDDTDVRTTSTAARGGAIVNAVLKSVVGNSPGAGFNTMRFLEADPPYYADAHAEFWLHFQTGGLLVGNP